MAATATVCIVLDGANVATRKDGQRAIPRLAAALTFFRELQQSRKCALRCVAFVPNFWLNTKPADASKGNGSMETDDWELLQSLVDQELVVLTPSHAHDDFYVIDYAVKNDGFIVTNDMFRDHVEHKRVFQGRRLTQRWTRSRCIDFTFVGNEFLPNSQTVEKALTHVPRPNSPRDTVPVTPSASGEPATAERPAQEKSTPSKFQRKSLTSRSSSLTSSSKPLAKDRADEDDDDDDDGVADDANGMSIDHVRKKNVDLSELTPYRVPRYLLPLLHGDDGQTLGRFMDHTGTYIVAPALTSTTTSEVATLSIYGSEPNRMHAVKILDAALPELLQQYEFQQQQQQQQQWLLAQQQQQQQQQFAHPQDLHFQQQQQLLQQQQLQQQQQLLQQQYYQQQQQQQYLQQQQLHQFHHQHQHHPPANYPLQQHHAHGTGDDGMDLEM